MTGYFFLNRLTWELYFTLFEFLIGNLLKKRKNILYELIIRANLFPKNHQKRS